MQLVLSTESWAIQYSTVDCIELRDDTLIITLKDNTTRKEFIESEVDAIRTYESLTQEWNIYLNWYHGVEGK